MQISLLIIGLSLLCIGGWVSSYQKRYKRQSVIESENLTYLNQMQKKEINQNSQAFLEQFELTQQQLESLYTQDFTGVNHRINELESHFRRQEEMLTTIQIQLSQMLSNLRNDMDSNRYMTDKKYLENSRISEDNETIVAPNINFNSDITLKLEQVMQLQKAGLKTEEVAKKLNMGKGEVLLLNNLLKK